LETVYVEIRANEQLNKVLNFLDHLRALRIAPGSGLRLGAIHRIAWKWNSQKFALSLGFVAS
jgi:hypothetical protein